MKRYLSRTRKDVHISVTITGSDEARRNKAAAEVKKAIQNMNRISKHSNPPHEGVSYEINF